MRSPLLLAVVPALFTVVACGGDSDPMMTGAGAVAVDAGVTSTVATQPPVSMPATPAADAGVGAPPPPAQQPAPPNQLAANGESCARSADCAGGACVASTCTSLCDIERANSCRDAGGFCVPVGSGRTIDAFACSGDLKTGADEDDAILTVGDAVTRSLGTLKDADLFTVDTGRGGDLLVVVEPSAGVDAQIDVYDPLGQQIGTFNSQGLGMAEAVRMSGARADAYFFVVVRNVGNGTGKYKLSVLLEN